MNFFSSKIVIDDKELSKILEIINTCYINQSQLLYLQKKEFNELEKFVYDLAIIHLEKNNNDLNDNIFIEFKVETVINSSMEIVYDKFNKIINKSNQIISPFLTTITYLDDIEIPDIITDVDIEMFKYKTFSNNKLYFSFPSLLKHIYFDGGKFYSSNCNILNVNKERKILRVNLWNICPLNIPYYINSFENNETVNKIDKIIKLENTNNLKNILLNDIQLDNIFFEKKQKKYFQKKIVSKQNTKEVSNLNRVILFTRYFIYHIIRITKNNSSKKEKSCIKCNFFV